MFGRVYKMIVMDQNPYINPAAKEINNLEYTFPTELARHNRQKDEEARGRVCMCWFEDIPPAPDNFAR